MCAVWKKKNERNEIVCFYCTQSDILLCGIARFSRGNKNKLRIFQSQKWKKIKNSQPQTKFTGSYKKRVYSTSQSTQGSLLSTRTSRSLLSTRKSLRLIIFPTIPTLLYELRKAAIAQQDLQKLILISYFTKSLLTHAFNIVF